MNSQTLKYLKQDEIGKVIAKGLADVYKSKPEMPVKFLGQWLKNYSKNQRQLQNIIRDQSIKGENLLIYKSQEQVKRIKLEQQTRSEQQKSQKITGFKKMVQDHEYQEQLLEQQFPQFIANQLGITGAYIGELDYPKKQVNDQDTDQNAHLDMNAAKLINYIGSCVSHKQLMRGQVLSIDQGVTGSAFALATQQQPAKLNEEAQEHSVTKAKYIYIPNVVRQEKMHYFRLPKLGSFLAVPMVYNSWLSEPVFDAAYQSRKQYLDDLDQFTTKKQQDIKIFENQIQQAQKKLADLEAKGADVSQIDSIKDQINEIKEKIEARKKETIDRPEPQLTLGKRQFVVAVDNLGTDQELSQKNIEFIVDMVDHFKLSCQNKQKELLNKDVEAQITYVNRLQKPANQILQDVNKALELSEQNKKQLSQIQNETLKKYKEEELQFQTLKLLAKNESKFLNAFLKLKDFRIVKFRQLIQNILHFLCYKKSEINLAGKTIINWKDIKGKCISKQTYERIMAYVLQGPKQQEFPSYCKTTYLSPYFDQLKLEQVFEYNIGLGILAMFIQKALKHRISNVQWRKQQRQQQRKERQEIIAKNEQIMEQKAQALQKQKQTLSPEEAQTFNQEQWGTAYDVQHPLGEEPPEVSQDIDNDM